MKESGIHEGHRARIDKKAKIMGFEFLEEHEQLEKILFTVMPRGNTNEIAKRLLAEFGSLYGVLTAEPEQLKRVEGVGVRMAEFLHDLMPLLGVVERCELRSKTGKAVLDSQEKIGEFAKTLFNGKVVEALYMISLNHMRRIIRYEKISEGNAMSTAVTVHNVAKRAILNEAYSVVLAHNHPGGRLIPSVADMNMTREIKTALAALDIQLIDHIIVGCGEWTSIMR